MGKKKAASATYWTDLILCLQSAAVHPGCRMILSISPSPTTWRAASSLISNRLTSWSGGERLVMGSCIKGTDNKASIVRLCSKIPERILKQPQWGKQVTIFVSFPRDFKECPINHSFTYSLLSLFSFLPSALIHLLVIFSVCAWCSWL